MTAEREQHEMGEGHEIDGQAFIPLPFFLAGPLSLVFPQKGVGAGNGRCRSRPPPGNLSPSSALALSPDRTELLRASTLLDTDMVH